MSMVRWDPFPEMTALRDAMDKLWGTTMTAPSHFWPAPAEGLLPIDMYQTNDDVVIKASLPGVSPDQVDISVAGQTVTIKGEQRKEEEIRDEDYLYRERRQGQINRVIQIPVEVQGEKAEAEFENGILTLRLPKAEQIKPKRIEVKPMIEGKK